MTIAEHVYKISQELPPNMLLELLDFYKLNQLLKEVQRRLDTLNLVDSINNENDNTNLINTALEDIFFQFTKISEEEMIFADQLRNQLRQTREELQRNIYSCFCIQGALKISMQR